MLDKIFTCKDCGREFTVSSEEGVLKLKGFGGELYPTKDGVAVFCRKCWKDVGIVEEVE